MQKDFEAFIGQGEQAQGGSWRLTKEEGIVCVYGKRKKRRRKCEEYFSSYVCKNQAWEECV